VDFFTPVVDDPFTYGQIAAANAMSDVYAMGGRPITALNLVCWPQTGLPREMLHEVLRGGSEKAKEAGALIVGGHSVADEEVKYGMAVTGLIDPRRVIRNVGAQVGDALILTKPLGTGVLMTAFKRDRLAPEYYSSAVATMVELNARAAEVMLRFEVHAATDITGFGLVGHSSKMADGSGVTIVFEESAAGRPGMLSGRPDSRRRRAKSRILRIAGEDFRRNIRRDEHPRVRSANLGRVVDRGTRTRRDQTGRRPPPSRGGRSVHRRASRRAVRFRNRNRVILERS